MTSRCQMSLSALVPRLTPTRPAELGKMLEMTHVPTVPDGMYPHQIRTQRAARNTTGLCLIQHAGQGKTRAMIAAVEQFRNSICAPRVYVITKKTIKGYTTDDITDFSENTGMGQQETLSYYAFSTYDRFNSMYGAKTPEELQHEFKRAIFVIDEFHNVLSYRKRQVPNVRSLFETLVVLRNYLPNALFIAMSATPMLNSAYEIRFLAHVLLTQDALGPNCEDYLGAALGSGSDAPYVPRAGGSGDGAIPDELFDGNFNEDQWYAQMLVTNVPFIYKGPPRAARQTRFGTTFQSDTLVTQLHDSGTVSRVDPETPDESSSTRTYTRKILEMGESQSAKYLSCFSKRDFYRTARELSICDVDGLMSFNLNNIRTVEDVRNHSALMAYWLDIENAALKAGHWGVSAWYFDDIVERGARVFARVLQHFGWSEFGSGGPGPKVLLLTGDDALTAASRDALLSDGNLRGELIRTIIYTKAIRDGVSFPGVLRGGSVLGWSEAGQLQADARRLRVNSFDMFTSQDFLRENAPYVLKDASGRPVLRPGSQRYEITPHTYDVLSIPADQNPSPSSEVASLGVPYSIDAHMLNIRSRKGDDIGKIFNILIEGSIDSIAARTASPAGFGNYITHYAHDDLRQTIRHFNPSGLPRSILGSAPSLIPAEFKYYEASRAFCAPPGGEMVGPLGGNRDWAWGIGSMGFGPAPIDLEAAAATDFGDPDTLDIFQHAFSPFGETITRLNTILTRALRDLVEFIQPRVKSIGIAGVGHRFDQQDFEGLRSKLGTAPMVLLAMYARFWCIGTIGGNVAVSERFPRDPKEAPAAERTRVATWKDMSTTIFEENTTRAAIVSWFPPMHRDLWTDTLSLNYFIQQCARSKPGVEFSYVVVTHTGKSAIIKYNPASPPVYTLFPGVKPPARTGGNRNSPGQNADILPVVAINIDERNPMVNSQHSVHISNAALNHVMEGRVFKFVLIPEDEWGVRAQFNFINPDIPPDPQPARRGYLDQYLKWTFNILKHRLMNPWSPGN